jgi:hypothetical protein
VPEVLAEAVVELAEAEEVEEEAPVEIISRLIIVKIKRWHEVVHVWKKSVLGVAIR